MPAIFIRNLVFIVLVLLSFPGCQDPPQPAGSKTHFGMMDDTLINLNKKVVKSEDEDIADFIERYGWVMKKSTTGLRSMIYSRGSGARAKEGMTAVIHFEVKLLNGNLCYTSRGKSPAEFVIGHSGLESGLEEGILLMKKGDKAKFIVPSHLAFGLVGDQDKIPPRAVLVYDVELVDLKVKK
jgi:FKBP-type peptidyl-prolyl cis-trans isomerase FkpA